MDLRQREHVHAVMRLASDGRNGWPGGPRRPEGALAPPRRPRSPLGRVP